MSSLPIESQLRQLIVVIALRLSLPIFLLFWGVDLLIFPELRWQLLGARIWIIPISFIAAYASKLHIGNLRWAQIVMALLLVGNSLIGNVIVGITGGALSPYFDFFNLITLGSVPFVPLPLKALIFTMSINGGPLLLYGILTTDSPTQLNEMVVRGAGMVSTFAIAFVLRTVTNRLRESQLEATEQLGKNARQVAHDIRSPLTVLRLVVSELKQIPDAHQSLLQHAMTRIEGIANDLLGKHARTGTVSNLLSKLDLTPILERLVREKKKEFHHRSELQIQLEIPKECANTAAYIDSGDLFRALSNLINNAAEATHGRPTAKITVGMRCEGRWLHLVIGDDGPGIDSKVLNRIREGGVSHGKPQGSGLGIKQVRNAADKAGGSFSLDSIVGSGTKATVILPLA